MGRLGGVAEWLQGLTRGSSDCDCSSSLNASINRQQPAPASDKMDVAQNTGEGGKVETKGEPVGSVG